MQNILKQAKPTQTHEVSLRSLKESAQKSPTSKRGELLIYRPRTAGAAGTTTQADAPTVAGSKASKTATLTIRYGGRDYLASRSMAESFLKRARAIIDADGSDLVPLLHHGGIDLLLITGSTSVDVQGSAL